MSENALSATAILEAALQMADLGIPVFPCGKDKKPITSHGFKDATTDRSQIEKWWSQHADAMIGVPTGIASGIDVLDLDNKNGKDGFAAVPDWQQRSPIVVRTPSGGAHAWFKSTGTLRNSASKIAPGVDTRGNGGYVIAPPSMNGVAAYRFERGGLEDVKILPEFPADLRDRIEVRPQPAPITIRKVTSTHGIAEVSLAATAELDAACAEMANSREGNRNADLNRLTFLMGQLVGSGRLTEEIVEERLGAAASGAGLPDGEISVTIRSGLAAGKKSPRFPTIFVVQGKIAENIDFAEAEMMAAGLPIFQRAGQLVTPVVSTLPAADDRKTDVVLLSSMGASNVVYQLNKHAAVFKKYNERKKAFLPTDPPISVASGLVHKGQWSFPRVAGVVTTPTMRPDGSILDHPGYDPATQLLFVPDQSVEVPPIKVEPSREDAEQALDLLRDLLGEFPLESATDRAVALAALMTPVLRGAFDVGPMFLIIAHDAGSGKSYLVNLAGAIAMGKRCPVITSVKNEEEMEKRLGALILQGSPMISLDNCSHDLGGDLLCQITEQQLVRVRILGKSEVPECEWRGTMFGTGNNVTLVGDMTRRGLSCNLDAGMERPELRAFKSDPVKTVMANRGDYIAAAITIARAWRVSGEPEQGSPLASYGLWSKAVRQPLMWLGETDPVKSMDALRQEDPERVAAHELIALWKISLASGVSYSAAELVRAAEETKVTSVMTTGHADWTYVRPELRQLLLNQAGNIKGQIDTKRVGQWLARLRGKVHGSHRIDLVRESSHGTKYLLRGIKVGGM